ncbi:hypothetical protein GQF61_04615 [Sphingobacterium sp. DK4209]|uniref:Carboxypeptidase-like regulatory domain-containing protein n=1 Tax=Sphingobacterium zhuxiongii TaxID=2662364 RepID=A0A5Q0QEU8_9SPHI|nr:MULTISPECIES: hypothetical protein [unclassified Sphingobacterium]MVZ65124.1 hypothetical protein [Sphingobacterium sp. DK4209]QGA26072.1 hypothetical protein GFH32_06945 [Sphingobacterium sp. dk4302]
MKNIKIIAFLTLILLGNIGIAAAQQIKGLVFDLENSQRLSEVLIENISNNKSTKTAADGSFTIDGKKNDYLVLKGKGYDRDTAFIYQDGISRIYLVRDKSIIRIDEVTVTRMTDSRLNTEIERAKNNSQAVETSKTRGGLRVSPSRLFGKEAKIARNSIKILELEKEQRLVDRTFTNELILSLISLPTDQLALFRDKYRPTYAFIKAARKEDLTAYILDSYAKFKKQ